MQSARIDVNFIFKTNLILERDKELFFQDEEVVFVDQTLTMIDLLVLSGVFESKGQARKNGVCKQLIGNELQSAVKADSIKIPSGFSEWQTGKLKHKITILNIKESDND